MARLATVAELFGVVAIVVGLWIMWPPAALVVAGLAIVVLAQGIGKGQP